MQTLLTRRHHRVADVHAVQNFHLAGRTQPHFDFRPQRGLRLAIGRLDQLDNELLAALRNNGFFRHNTGFVFNAKHRIYTCEHAGFELRLTVVNAGAHAHRAPVGVNQRVNGLNLCSKFTARQRVKVKLRCLPAFDFCLKAFGQAIVNKNRVHVFDIDDVCAVF